MTAPRVAIDVRGIQRGFKSHSGRGIGRYVTALTREILRREGAERFGFLAEAPGEVDAPLPAARIFRVDAPAWTERLGELAVHARQHLVWPRRLESLPFDLFHFCSQTDAPARLDAPYAVSVLDLIPHRMESVYGRGKSRVRYRLARWLERRALRRARGLVAISEFTKRDLVDLLGYPPERVFVTPLGVDERFRPPGEGTVAAFLRRHQLRSPYLLYVGGIDRRKNVPLLLEAMREIDGRRHDVELVLAGGYREDPDYPALVARIHELGLERSVRLLGFVAEEELPALYAGAAAFVFPSLYEGFGLPPLEAMACGAAVIAARRTSLPEVLGGAAVYFDPEDPAALVEAALALVDHPERRRELAAAGVRHARGFRWERTASLTIEAWAEIVSIGA